VSQLRHLEGESRGRPRKSSCPSNKVKFKSRREALAFHDRRYPGTYRRAYKCWSCSRWHLSTLPLVDVAAVRARIR
jgi:hypothetical protein